MGEIYKGWELMKAIADEEIKKGTKFKDKDKKEVEWNGNNLVCIDLGENYMCTISDIYFINEEFELIEDEIDIDSIEEYKQEHTERCIDIDIRNKINEILQAVKQINKKVEELGWK